MLLSRSTCLAIAAIAPVALAKLWPYQTFVTEPTFHPPVLDVTKTGDELADGLILFTPSIQSLKDINSRELAGAMIMTDEGELVWYGETATPQTNLFVQKLDGKQVLTRWHGQGSNVGHGYGSVIILDDTYSPIYEICPKPDFVSNDGREYDCWADLHESFITDQDTILVTAVNTTKADLSSVGGPVDGWILDDWIFEIDPKTNETVFSWNSLSAGISLDLSKVSIESNNAGNGSSKLAAWDWFHMNSIQRIGDKYLLSSRHTWSIILLDRGGNVEWYLDGSDGGNFTLPSSDIFKWQHHARIKDSTESSLQLDCFDNSNSGWDNGTNPSSGLILELNTQDKSVKILHRLQDLGDEIYTQSQGSFWSLDNQNHMVGYGSIPKIKEYGPDGTTRMTIRFGEDNLVQSYRSYRQEWSATPFYKPKIKVHNQTVYMSWNGATGVTQWEILAGMSKDGLRSIGTVEKKRFESSFTLTSPVRFVQIAAYSGDKLLRKSDLVYGF